MIIEIEGIDGVGKTTQCRLLNHWFERQGQRSIIVKDLESTQLGRQIKSILTADTPITKEAELFAFLCCKAHLFSEIIGPEVAKGANIICDRGVGSLLSYFEDANFDTEFLNRLVKTVCPASFAPTTVLLDLDPGEAMSRNVAKPTHSRFDNLGAAFFQRQRKIFLRLATENNWLVIDANQTIDEIHQSIADKLSRK
ncbi:MAG: dTMP kinase [Candidatus Paceibacterota bacterium]|jgi:dTMP kinase